MYPISVLIAVASCCFAAIRGTKTKGDIPFNSVLR